MFEDKITADTKNDISQIKLLLEQTASVFTDSIDNI